MAAAMQQRIYVYWFHNIAMYNQSFNSLGSSGYSEHTPVSNAVLCLFHMSTQAVALQHHLWGIHTIDFQPACVNQTTRWLGLPSPQSHKQLASHPTVFPTLLCIVLVETRIIASTGHPQASAAASSIKHRRHTSDILP